ncbi:flagellar protein FliS [bacterium]|nr:flagellar protein FliS [bacterium]
MAADLSQQYRENTVAQADPLRLVSLMYEGATRFVKRAKKAALDGEVEREIEEATRFADESPAPPPEALFEDVYA